MCVHRPQAYRHGIHSLLQLLLEIGDLVLLVRKDLRPVVRVAAVEAHSIALAEVHSQHEGPAQQPQAEHPGQTQRHRMRQVQLPGRAPTLGEKDDVHPVRSVWVPSIPARRHRHRKSPHRA